MTNNDSDNRVKAIVHEALRQGALPSLKCVDVVELERPAERALLTEGHVAAMHELYVEIVCVEHVPVEPQLAALDLVRQLPALAKLDLVVQGNGDSPVHWPPFIPPSLKSLCIALWSNAIPSTKSLMHALPSMLGASGARLEHLEVILPDRFEYLGGGLIPLAQVLRCCSPTLNKLRIALCDIPAADDPDRAQDNLEHKERLCVEWPGVLAGVSACRELQVLMLPDMLLEPRFPPGTAFARLTELEVSDYEREHPPDAGVMGLWELMASGGMPGLAKLSVCLEGKWGGVEEVRSRAVPALEVVAGTLIQLCLEKDDFDIKWSSDEVDVGYELGVAVGKLRRLKHLELQLSKDGQVYHAFAQGLAASGGDRPLPVLWCVELPSEVEANADQVASLLLPSVRVFDSSCCDLSPALLMACALRQAGYLGVVYLDKLNIESVRVLQEVASCTRIVDVKHAGT
jgi:hypothetical protein